MRPLEAPSWLTAEPREHGEDRVAVALVRRRGAPGRARRRPPTSRCRRLPRRRTCSARRGARPRWRLNSTKASGVESTVTPPARARVHSPCAQGLAARCMATSEEEQAVSIGDGRALEAERVGDTTGGDAGRSAGDAVALQPSAEAPGPTGSRASRSPTKTPVSVPRSAAGSMPASSSASQQDSSSSRCCGSIASASRGAMPKNSASNSPASARKPPSRA